MDRHPFRAGPLALCCAVCVLAALTTSSRSALAQKKPDPKKRDVDVARYTKQLMTRFNVWDTNNDNVLDKAELAKAFRGKSARPYDYQPPDPSDPFASTRETARVILAALLASPRQPQAVTLTAAEILELRTPRATSSTKVRPTPNYNALPDYQFLVLAGTRGQSKLTKKEFETWARNYARMVDEQEESRRHVQTAQGKFQKAKTLKARQAAQLEMERYSREYNQVTAQLNAIPAAIHKALNLKR
jgi:hypothetical protein